MTRAFERFLRTFSDEDLLAYAHEQVARRSTYRRAMELAVRIELDRRDLRLAMEGDSTAEDDQPGDEPEPETVGS